MAQRITHFLRMDAPLGKSKIQAEILEALLNLILALGSIITTLLLVLKRGSTLQITISNLHCSKRWALNQQTALLVQI